MKKLAELFLNSPFKYLLWIVLVVFLIPFFKLALKAIKSLSSGIDSEMSGSLNGLTTQQKSIVNEVYDILDSELSLSWWEDADEDRIINAVNRLPNTETAKAISRLWSYKKQKSLYDSLDSALDLLDFAKIRTNILTEIKNN